MNNGFDLLIAWLWQWKDNGSMWFYHYFHDTNAKFYQWTRFNIYIIFKNNYVCVDIIIVKYYF
jgi:hypothetical protein